MKVSPISLQVKEFITIPELTISDAKVKKTAYAVFSATSFFVANGLLALGGVISFFSLPLYALTLTFALRFFQVNDYENPINLKQYKEEAREQTFEEVIRSHGLENTLLHEILSLPDFAEKLYTHAKTLSPTAIAKLYIQLKDILKGTDISMENFRERIKDCMKIALTDKTLAMTFEEEDMNLLIQSGLISKHLASSYSNYQSLKEDHVNYQTKIREEFKETLLANIATFEQEISEFIPNQDSGSIQTLKKDLEYLKNHPNIENIDTQLPIWKDLKELPPNLELIHWEFKETYIQLIETITDQLKQDRLDFQQVISEMNSQYN